jgi:XTP/dITP diphosphohydrolase
MDVVRIAEKGIAEGRRGSEVPEELDVAPLDSITEEEWRIYLPIAAGAELAVEPEPAPQQVAEPAPEPVPEPSAGPVPEAVPEHVPEPSPADVPEPRPVEVLEPAPAEVPEPAAEQAAAEQAATEHAATEHAHAEEFPAGKLPVLQEVNPEANGAVPDSEGTQAHSDAPGGQPDTVEPQ